MNAARKIASCSLSIALWLLPACGGSSGTADADGGDAGADVAADQAPDAAPDAAEAETEAEAEADASPEDAAPDESAADYADLPCPDPDASFDPDHPGMHMFFTVAEVYMMGTAVNTAVGGFLPAAREDFNPVVPSDIPLDTCRLASTVTSTPECTTSADCVPPQQCVPETDASGNPIAGTGVCQTTRSPVNVGPFTCTGFTSPQTFQYNASQQGAYTSTADGTLPAGTLAYDTTYDCAGAGSTTLGFGPFHGTIYLAKQLEVTSPVPTIGSMGFPLINVDPAADLSLAWTGGDGTSDLLINLSGRSDSVECRVTDDGAFVIPAALITATGLGDVAFLNSLEIRRDRTGSACGVDLTDTEWTSTISVVLNVRKAATTTSP